MEGDEGEQEEEKEVEGGDGLTRVLTSPTMSLKTYSGPQNT